MSNRYKHEFDAFTDLTNTDSECWFSVVELRSTDNLQSNEFCDSQVSPNVSPRGTGSAVCRLEGTACQVGASDLIL